MTINCNRCGQEIHFDDSLKSSTGKKIPLQGPKGYDKHDCPNNPYKQLAEAGNKATNSADLGKATLDRVEQKLEQSLENQAEILRKVEGFFAAWTAESNYKKASELKKE